MPCRCLLSPCITAAEDIFALPSLGMPSQGVAILQNRSLSPFTALRGRDHLVAARVSNTSCIAPQALKDILPLAGISTFSPFWGLRPVLGGL